MAKTTIEWTDYTFNAWRSCQHLVLADGTTHPACEHCYAETMANRFPEKLGTWGPDGTRIMAPEKYWQQPIAWNAAAARADRRAKVFCASIADVFEDWQGPIHNPQGDMLGYSDGEFHTIVSKTPYAATMANMRKKLFELIDQTPHLDWQLLTKRPGNILKMTPPYAYHACETGDCPHDRSSECNSEAARKYRDNVWLGTSISNYQTAEELIPQLLTARDLAPVLFLSVEPLLGKVELRDLMTTRCPRCGVWVYKAVQTPETWCPSCCIEECNSGATPEHHGMFPTKSIIDWVICGGESGRQARPMHPDWARSLRDQCQAAGVPFFFKQHGEWLGALQDGAPGDGQEINASDVPIRVGKKAAGRLLDGREWNEFPEEVAHV